jgi:hypothetical protein
MDAGMIQPLSVEFPAPPAALAGVGVAWGVEVSTVADRMGVGESSGAAGASTPGVAVTGAGVVALEPGSLPHTSCPSIYTVTRSQSTKSVAGEKL